MRHFVKLTYSSNMGAVVKEDSFLKMEERLSRRKKFSQVEISKMAWGFSNKGGSSKTRGFSSDVLLQRRGIFSE